MSKDYVLGDIERMKAYKNPDGDGYLIGLMIADACWMMLTDRDIKRYRRDLHEFVDRSVDEIEEQSKKDYTLKDAKT